jgi:hypothetical protein
VAPAYQGDDRLFNSLLLTDDYAGYVVNDLLDLGLGDVTILHHVLLGTT